MALGKDYSRPVVGWLAACVAATIAIYLLWCANAAIAQGFPGVVVAGILFFVGIAPVIFIIVLIFSGLPAMMLIALSETLKIRSVLFFAAPAPIVLHRAHQPNGFTRSQPRSGTRPTRRRAARKSKGPLLNLDRLRQALVFGAKHFLKRLPERDTDIRRCRGETEIGQARDAIARVSDATRDDGGEMGQVGIDVDRDAVKRHPAPQPHADRGDLVLEAVASVWPGHPH